ncbi:MAG: acyl-CoA dehydrogenase family protein [Truepera sp.]|nr:acyl-CoA dehydrogenase family protein [Truepera sp.]
MTTTGLHVPGGSFIIRTAAPEEVFTPEDLSAEHRAVLGAVREFVAREVVSRREAVEAKDYALHRELLARLGAGGFLGVDVPEAYGGLGLDKVTSLIVSEGLAEAGSFAVTYGAHAIIGTLGIVFFGTEEQKQRYLPGLASGRMVGAYALTEPGTGSDAMGITTRAEQDADGNWSLNGVKQFITNAGFADLFTVYAKVDGEKFSAFLVERGTQGLTLGEEEKKMGTHGASCRAVNLNGVKVGAGNLLHEIGKGHHVAFNVLNMGRFKLAAGCLGGMKSALGVAVRYARERRAFGKTITEFGAIQHKLAEMAVRTFAVESMIYRSGGLIDARLASVTESAAEARALEEYAIECSIAKVYASEQLGYVVDELVQIHGGYGYIEEYPAAAAYRDARIHRIWEGTNEINRLLVPGTLLKRALQGRLDLLTTARRAADQITSAGMPASPAGGHLAEEQALVDAARQATLFVAGAAVQKFADRLEHEQEVLLGLADLAIEVLAMDSACLRARKSQAAGRRTAEHHAELARVIVSDGVTRIEAAARPILAALEQGDALRTMLAGLRRVLRGNPADTIALRRRIAQRVLEQGGYEA